MSEKEIKIDNFIQQESTLAQGKGFP